MRAVDLVVGRAKNEESKRKHFFRFDSWPSHQAASAGRWAKMMEEKELVT
jgi:hypothetical protein